MNFIKAGVVIKKEEKYLLVKEKAKRAYGLWNIPSGKVEEGMTIEQTAIQEAKEETNLEVELIREIKKFTETFRDTQELHVFEARIIGGELSYPEDEILDARWFTLEEIESMKDKLVGPWILEAVMLYSPHDTHNNPNN